MLLPGLQPKLLTGCGKRGVRASRRMIACRVGQEAWYHTFCMRLIDHNMLY
jgi:hypothetical protein